MSGVFHTIEHATGSQSGFLAGADSDHVPCLVAALLVPAAAWGFLKLSRAAASRGFRPAVRFVRGYDEASLVTRVAALLLLMTGFIHVGLVPDHAAIDPRLAKLFALNGLAFVGVAIGALSFRHWRPFAAVLLVATVVAYLAQVGSQHEAVDSIGMLTKLVELLALGLVLIPDRAASPSTGTALRWSGAVVSILLLTTITGTVTWGAELRSGQDAHATPAAEFAIESEGISGRTVAHHEMAGMVMQPVPTTPPTAQQRAAAGKLVADTKAAISKYEDVNVASADGYRPSTAPEGGTVHYTNWAYTHDTKILDATRPEALVYANTKHGTVLLGAMYMMPTPGQPGPDIGGSITQWHFHTNICWSLSSMTLAGIATPFGTCPAASLPITTAAMLHVWTIPNPTGSFGDLDPAWLAQLIRRP